MTVPSFPAVIDLAEGKTHALAADKPFVVGRGEKADLSVPNRACSRQHFRIARDGDDWFVEALAADNPTFVDGLAISVPHRLHHRALIRAGDNEFRFLLHADAGQISQVAASRVEGAATVRVETGSLDTLVLDRNFPLSGKMLIGRDASAAIPLPHPQVSRWHALITVIDPQRAELRDLGSANGTFVNGERLSSTPVALRIGDQINLGPFALEFTGPELVSHARSNNIELVARDITRVVTDRQTGRPLTLLDAITLVFRPREFVCLLGPSGSGKSTLMAALSGRATPDHGSVLVNGQDLHVHFDAIKQDIALVPQRDVLHDSLSVGQALNYTAKLRLPPDITGHEIETIIVDILDTVQLSHRRGTVIRHLSGGQVKRASLANEIICKPSLLFLDEVTSGLDEQTDRGMMDLFRRVAESGKTVVCITHSLTNVERTCHLIVVLTPGGKLAFVGPPSEALAYFGIERLGDVYTQLEKQPAEHWRKQFLESSYYQKYVVERLPQAPPPPRRERRQQAARRLFELSKRSLRQTGLLTRRYLAIWRGDSLSLAAMLGQALLVAFLLMAVFGDLAKPNADLEKSRGEADAAAKSVGFMFPQMKQELALKLHDLDMRIAHDKSQRAVNILFLLAVSSFWFGCNNAAKEMVKERTIFNRERDYNLLAGSYYASKLLVLLAFGFIQTLVLFLLVRFWCQPPGCLWGQLGVLLMMSLAGTTLGLLISTLANSEEMAVTLIPVAIIPQIILSGGVAQVTGIAKWLAMFGITTYWGKRGMDALLPDDLAKTAADAGLASPGGLALPPSVILIHTLLFIVGALLALMLQSRKAAMMVQHIKRVVRKSERRGDSRTR